MWRLNQIFCLVGVILTASSFFLFYWSTINLNSSNASKEQQQQQQWSESATANEIQTRKQRPMHVLDLESNTTDKNSSVDYNRTLTLLVHLSGELGNHLSLLANAYLVQRYVERELPGVTIHMVGVHQNAPKWKTAGQDLKLCFNKFANFHLEGGIWENDDDDNNHPHHHDYSFREIRERRKIWLGKNTSLLVNVLTPLQIQFLKSLLDQQARGDPQAPPIPPLLLHHTTTTTTTQYSLPYLVAKRFAQPQEILENATIYQEIRSLFEFNHRNCCREKAQPDEMVWHFRNFATDIQRPAVLQQHLELSPLDTARILLLPDSPQDNNNRSRIPKQIAIISRFTNEELDHYVEALQQRQQHSQGQIRVLRGQTGVQDFCLALSAFYLVGMTTSTYALWAGILGNATTVRWYSVDPSKALSSWQQKQLAHVIQGREFWIEVYGGKSPKYKNI